MLQPLSSHAECRVPAVLVAEDEALVRFALSDSLADRGLRVFEAATAAEAIAVLEAEPDIDLVFTDIRMPGAMDGIDLAKWVERHRPGLAVVLTSGDGRAAADFCIDGRFIAKPYDLQSVVERIADLARIGAG